MRRVTGIFLLFIVLAASALWLGRARLASFLATSLLDRAGFSAIEVKVAALNSESFSIERLCLTRTASGMSFDIELNGLYVTFQPETLWKQRRVDKVTVRSAVILFHPRANDSSREPLDLSGISTLLQADWLEYLPLQYLRIDRLVFRDPPGLSPGRRVITLTVRHDPDRLLADVDLPSIRRNIRFSLVGEQGLEAQLVLKSRYHPAVNLALRAEQGERLGLAWQGKLDALREWFAPLYSLPALDGGFLGRVSFPLHSGSRLLLTVDAGVDRLQTHGLGIGSLHLTGSLEFTGKDNSLIRLGPDLELDLRDLRSSTLHVRRAGLILDGLAEQRNGRWRIRLQPERDWHLADLSRGNLEVTGITVRPDFTFTEEEKQWRLELGRDFFCQASGCRLDTFRAERIRLTPAWPALLVLSSGAPFSWQVAPSDWLLDCTGVRQEPWLVVEDNPLEIRLDVLEGGHDTWTVQAGISSSRLSLGGPFSTTLTDLAAQVHGDEKKLALELLFSPENTPGRLAVDLALETGSGQVQGRLRTRAPIVLGEGVSLSALVDPWPLPVDLEAGALEAGAVFSRVPGQGIWLSTRFGLTGARGTIGKTVQFTGLDLEQELSLLPDISTLRPGMVRCEKITLPGRVEVTGVEAFTELKNGESDGPEVVLENLRAALFNGLVVAPRIKYDLVSRTADFTLNLRQVDLEEILKLYPVSGLEVSGSVSGLLPIHVRGLDVRVRDGRLVAEPPGGVIRYRPEKDYDKQGLTGITLRALRELHYRNLDVEVSYLPDGTLDLNFHFKGKSPELDPDRPVHLNINTSQNLLSLLRSLSYTEKIDADISRRAEQGYRRGMKR
ncbi:intermembrane phospholipid transport protein YdbH family protein [Desulfolithobacter sp.]